MDQKLESIGVLVLFVIGYFVVLLFVNVVCGWCFHEINLLLILRKYVVLSVDKMLACGFKLCDPTAQMSPKKMQIQPSKCKETQDIAK